MASTLAIPLGARLPAALRIAIRIWLLAIASVRRALLPALDIVMRVVVAQALLRSAVVKLSDWDVALTLATHEYPVHFMAPATAAVVGVGIELVGARPGAPRRSVLRDGHHQPPRGHDAQSHGRFRWELG